MKIVPCGHVDRALRREPLRGKVFRLLVLNRDRHGLAVDLQRDHSVWLSHGRNLTRNVSRAGEPRRAREHQGGRDEEDKH
jgi:hypothetical protein